jgi:hypothetical protein
MVAGAGGMGRGLAREGAEAIRDEAFDVLNAPSVIARIQPANARSIAVAEATGLTRDFRATDKTGEPVVVYRLAAVDRSAASTGARRETAPGAGTRARSFS